MELMSSKKGVIRIISKSDYIHGYDTHYYFSDIKIDNDGHLMAGCTTNVWEAMKFIYNPDFKDEMNRINSLIEFIKTCYIPKKKYTVEFIPIELKY